MKKRITLLAVALGMVAAACSPQFQDLEGIEPKDPDSVQILRNVDGYPNINIVCLNGDALIMRSQNYEDMQILFVPDNENNLCES